MGYPICFCIVTVVLISLPILTFVYLSVVKQYPIDLSFSLVNVAKGILMLGLGMYLIDSPTIALFSRFDRCAAHLFCGLYHRSFKANPYDDGAAFDFDLIAGDTGNRAWSFLCAVFKGQCDHYGTLAIFSAGQSGAFLCLAVSACL